MNASPWLRRTAFAVLALAALLALAAAAGHRLAQRKLHRQVAVPKVVLDLADDSPHRATTLARGAYLYQSRGCTACHGSDATGVAFLHESNGLVVRAPNLTPAPDSPVRHYTVSDWVRTVRHGVKPDGTPALIMPSEDYARMSNADLAALVSYLRSLPARAGGPAIIELPLPLQLAYAAGVIQDAAEKIDHTLPPEPDQAPTVSVAYGHYVANMCVGCHGAGLSGGRIPGTPPDWPAAANLTPGAGSGMKAYTSAAQLAAMFATGHRPDGSAVSQVMPFLALRAMSQTDVGALYAYLHSLPPRPFGQR